MPPRSDTKVTQGPHNTGCTETPEAAAPSRSRWAASPRSRETCSAGATSISAVTPTSLPLRGKRARRRSPSTRGRDPEPTALARPTGRTPSHIGCTHIFRTHWGYANASAEQTGSTDGGARLRGPRDIRSCRLRLAPRLRLCPAMDFEPALGALLTASRGCPGEAVSAGSGGGSLAARRRAMTGAAQHTISGGDHASTSAPPRLPLRPNLENPSVRVRVSRFGGER
jgi:hypothetical protein